MEDYEVHLGHIECNLPLSFPSGDAKWAVKYMECRNEILSREINLGVIDIYSYLSHEYGLDGLG